MQSDILIISFVCRWIGFPKSDHIASYIATKQIESFASSWHMYHKNSESHESTKFYPLKYLGYRVLTVWVVIFEDLNLHGLKSYIGQFCGFIFLRYAYNMKTML